MLLAGVQDALLSAPSLIRRLVVHIALRFKYGLYKDAAFYLKCGLATAVMLLLYSADVYAGFSMEGGSRSNTQMLGDVSKRTGYTSPDKAVPPRENDRSAFDNMMTDLFDGQAQPPERGFSGRTGRVRPDKSVPARENRRSLIENFFSDLFEKNGRQRYHRYNEETGRIYSGRPYTESGPVFTGATSENAGPPLVISPTYYVPEILAAGPLRRLGPKGITDTSGVAQSWRARQGERVVLVLDRWAKRAGYDVQWRNPPDTRVLTDYSHIGDFGRAVVGLMRQATPLTYDPVFEIHTGNKRSGIPPHGAGRAPRAYSLTDPDYEGPQKGPVNNTSQVPGAVQKETWLYSGQPDHVFTNRFPANRGSSLEAVLQDWADRAGFELIWNAGHSYRVPRDIRAGQSFENAVSSVLDNWSGHSPRPYGEIYHNPETGRKALVILD